MGVQVSDMIRRPKNPDVFTPGDCWQVAIRAGCGWFEAMYNPTNDSFTKIKGKPSFKMTDGEKKEAAAIIRKRLSEGGII